MNVFRRSFGLVFSLLLLGTTSLGLWQRQAIADWVRLRDFEPSTRVAELAVHTTMTDYGRKLFYVHHPELNNKLEFTQSCPTGEQTIVLGCYITHQSIHIYDVQDARLDGIEEVTAAHEMLHAAYDRLNDGDREEVDKLLATAFANLTDERIKKVVASYEQRDASVVPNELHSIIGTELRELPASLEKYYSRYFSNRLKVVEYSEQYEAIFSAQQSQIQTLAKQISELESKLIADRQEIEFREKSLAEQSAELNSLRSSGQTEAYNAAVPGYNQQVNAYRNLVSRYNADVVRLNRLVEEHNGLAFEQKKLYDAINSSL